MNMLGDKMGDYPIIDDAKFKANVRRGEDKFL